MVYLILGYLVVAILLALSIGRKLREDNTDNEDPPISPSKGTNIKPNKGRKIILLVKTLVCVEVMISCAWMLTDAHGTFPKIDIGNISQVFFLVLMGLCVIWMFILNNRFVKKCDRYPQAE